MTLEELDKNMAITNVKTPNLVWHDRYTPGFSFDGCADLENFHRIDMAKHKDHLPEGVQYGYHCTGITLRFRTNATVVAVRAVNWLEAFMPIMPLTGSHGFDLYLADLPEEGGTSRLPRYKFTMRPMPTQPTVVADEYPFRVQDNPGSWHDVEIGFPLYNGVLEFEVGLNAEAEIAPPSPFAFEKPVLFYGSSITQGAAASRPGTCYTTMLARALRLPQINLGFSGRALGEPEMARYIAEQSLSALVMDYDHNAPNAEHLKKTHENFYKIIREAQPDLPIIMMTRPNYEINPGEAEENFAVIEATYQRAIAAGDKNLYLIDCRDVFGDDGEDACTVDTCHPTDLGFYRMYCAVRPVLEKALGIRKD